MVVAGGDILDNLASMTSFAGAPQDISTARRPSDRRKDPFPGKARNVQKVTLTRKATSPDERVGQIHDLFRHARQARRARVRQWDANHRILRNKTWSDKRDSWRPSPEDPQIYEIVAANVGWMTDQRPQFEVVPFAQMHSPLSDFYQKVGNDLQVALTASWSLNDYDREIELACWDLTICGIGVLKSCWENHLFQGLGDAMLRRVDPYAFYPDPDADSVDAANYFIEVRTMSLQELDRRWKGAAAKFPTGGVLEDHDEAPSVTGHGSSTAAMANPGSLDGSHYPQWGRPGDARLRVTEDPGVTVFEAWLREPNYWTDENGDEHIEDKWRVVVVAGQHVLMDEAADELWSHGQHPYDVILPHQTGEFYGISLVEMLTPAQRSINRILASIEHNVHLMGNPIMLEPKRGGTQRQTITNKPGTRVHYGDSSQPPGWLNPPVMHPQIATQLIDYWTKRMRDVSGLSAIARGQTPAGRNAADVLAAVQEAGFVRIRMALRNLERALKSAGEKITSLIAENYTQPRFVSFTGNGGQRSALALKARAFYIPTDDGAMPLRCFLNIEAGSSLATSRQARQSDAVQLFAMGIVDEEAVLDVFNWPNRAVILERVRAAKAAGLMQPPGARQRAGRTT